MAAKLLTDESLYEMIKKAKEEAENKGPRDVYVYIRYFYTPPEQLTLHFSNKPITDHGGYSVYESYFIDKDEKYSGVPPWYIPTNNGSNVMDITSEPNFIPTKSIANWFYGLGNVYDWSSVSTWDTKYVTDMEGTFGSENRYVSTVSSLDFLQNWDVSNVTDMSGMFHYNSGISSVEPISEWNVGNVVDMYGMFYECSGIKTFEPLNNWDVSKVTKHTDMFYRAYGTRPIWGKDW